MEPSTGPGAPKLAVPNGVAIVAWRSWYNWVLSNYEVKRLSECDHTRLVAFEMTESQYITPEEKTSPFWVAYENI